MVCPIVVFGVGHGKGAFDTKAAPPAKNYVSRSASTMPSPKM